MRQVWLVAPAPPPPPKRLALPTPTYKKVDM